jgi:mRNA m6A methyltransferase non-catalytic subunit
VILIDPPFSSSFTWDDLQDLPIPALVADPSFVLMWVGSGAGEGLERGREVMAKWGFRRCEDIVWVKTNNTTNRGPGVRYTLYSSAATLPESNFLNIDRPTYDITPNAY